VVAQECQQRSRGADSDSYGLGVDLNRNSSFKWNQCTSDFCSSSYPWRAYLPWCPFPSVGAGDTGAGNLPRTTLRLSRAGTTTLPRLTRPALR
jgi:hypothetical protein